MHERLAYIIKHNRLIQWVYRTVMGSFFRFIGLFIRTNEQLMLFSSYGGRQYSDSPRALYEAMCKDERFRDYRFVWAFEHPEKMDVEGAEKVKIDSLKYFKTALAAKCWITNVNIERGLKFKKKSTVYVNTWHGTGPKKSGNAIRGRKDYDFSYVDILCCDGEHTRSIMTKYFNAKDENLLWGGRPREDELLAFTREDASRIRAELGIPQDKKVILYMPTWREYDNRNLDFPLWEQALGDGYTVLVRAHHFTKGAVLKDVSDTMWKDVSSYPSVNRLYCIADLLISDYSSAFFDYGLLGKPMICYAYDYDQYTESTGLWMDMKNEFPRGVKETEAEVLDEVKKIFAEYEPASAEAKAYCDSYASHPGNATAACIERLWELITSRSSEKL